MTEKWKEVEGYNGAYFVSSSGRIISVMRGTPKELKGSINGQGYRQVALKKGGLQVMCAVHRLVAEAFIPNPYGKPCVNHRDFNRLNNKVENLEWVTYGENTNHSYDRIVSANRAKSCKPVIKYDRQGNYICRYESIAEAARHIGVGYVQIWRSINGYAHSAGGYLWRYAE